MESRQFRLACVVLSLIPWSNVNAADVKDAVDFNQKIAPLLASRCLSCHRGPKAKGRLDLSRRAKAFVGGRNGVAIRPKDLKKSLLWQRIAADEMPPKHPLSKIEKQLLKDWILRGAQWGYDPIDPFRFTTANRAGYDWWSLRPLVKPKIPAIQKDFWWTADLDRFILAKLKAKGLSPSPRATPRTLVRRLYYDLLGLTPPPSVIDRFSKNPSQDNWRKLVSKLLASKQYGERWARHWLDVARFGETHGYEYNAPRDGTWHYRDWVIRSLNQDLPYDQFTRLQIAGDIIKPNTLEGAAAVGFLVAGIHNTVVGQSPAMKASARQDELEEMAGTVAQTFLGLTVNCARCHDHKFDPISTKEYYQFIAALNGVRHGTRAIRELHQSRATKVFSVSPSKPGIMRVHLRGSVKNLGEEVGAGGLKAVNTVTPHFQITKRATDAQRRRKLADWISHRDNGPFHRVIVNRVWHHHFGQGLVSTPSDLGFNGGRPSHPELLDWLAIWFRDNGYSLKKLHKLILTSATWQQSSNVRLNSSHVTARKIDKSNRLLWRQNPRRVDAETLRDSMLEIAGVLNRQQFGPGFKDVRIDRVGSAHYYIAIDPIGKQYNRRTIYRWQARGQRSALLETFDCPDPSTATPVRNVTTTSSQALSQWNHAFVLRMSKHLAQRIKREVGTDVKKQVKHAWRLVLGRTPERKETELAMRLVRRNGLALLGRVLFNTNELIWIE